MFGPRPPIQPAEEAVEAPAAPEEDRIVAWRTETLVKAGYNELQAEILARARHVDLHEAVGLLEAGCPAAKAALILL